MWLMSHQPSWHSISLSINQILVYNCKFWEDSSLIVWVGGWVVFVVIVVVNWDSLCGHSSYAQWLWQHFDLANPSTLLQSMRTLYHLHHPLSQDQSTLVDLPCLSARWSHTLFDLPVHHTCAVVQIKSEFYTRKRKGQVCVEPPSSKSVPQGWVLSRTRERERTTSQRKKEACLGTHTHTHKRKQCTHSGEGR